MGKSGYKADSIRDKRLPYKRSILYHKTIKALDSNLTNGSLPVQVLEDEVDSRHVEAGGALQVREQLEGDVELARRLGGVDQVNDEVEDEVDNEGVLCLLENSLPAAGTITLYSRNPIL